MREKTRNFQKRKKIKISDSGKEKRMFSKVNYSFYQNFKKYLFQFAYRAKRPATHFIKIPSGGQ
jgi:hypothetical protein